MKAGTLVTDSVVLLLALAFGALSYVVPKRRGVIAFYPSFEPRRFAGNLRPVFAAMMAAPAAGRRPVWLTRSRAVAVDLTARGWPVHRSRGRPLWALLRAELILIDSTEPRIGFGRFRFVQAWHGSGFKQIGLAKEGRTPMRRAALAAHFRRYALIVAASPGDAARKAESFANRRVEILGSPRNDALVSGEAGAGLAGRLGIDPDTLVVSYAPTYREDGRVAPFTDADWYRLDGWAREAGAVVLVKRHGRDRALVVPPGLDRIRDVTAAVDDVQALLAISDVLVTDYSSIATDFALTGRPVIFYTYDAAHFRVTGRGLNAALMEVLPGPYAADTAALMRLLADRRWFDDPAYRVRYEAFRGTFHSFVDASSTDRLLAAVDRIRAER